MALNLFIIGPSGCGKSTQANLIADKYGLTYLSMGQMLRDEITSGTQLGLDAKKSVNDGVPTPDGIVFPLLSQKLASINYHNFIIDGYPRVISQGLFIDKLLAENSENLSLLIHLKVDFLEIIKRRQTLGQAFQDSSRSDNNPQAIANRQKILYESNIGQILNYYHQQNKLCEIDGNRPVEAIFVDIVKKIDNLLIKSK